MVVSRFVASFIVMMTMMSVSVCAVANDSEADVYARIEPSLALVIAGKAGKSSDIRLGTAFCIESLDDNNGYLLTNHHVIGNDPNPRVVLMSNPQHVLTASIVRTAGVDAAVILISSGCQPLSFSSQPPLPGTKIAIAGFPSFQVRMALAGLGLSPSFHEGTVSSVVGGGFAIEYDAQTDHGNSGSPLVDASTGSVYGLVTWVNTGETGALQDNLAIGVAALVPFLRNAHADVSYDASDPDTDAAASPSPSPAPTDNSACLSAVVAFENAYDDWDGAFERYVKSTQATSSAAAAATNRVGLIGAEVGVGLEMRAIKSVINAEEPKLTNAASEIQSSNAQQTSDLVANIVDNIHYLDSYALSWSQSRAQVISAAANGGYSQVDQDAFQRVRDLEQQVSQQLISLRDPNKVCES